jgi:transcriptional regulator with XRE-family HTH domain
LDAVAFGKRIREAREQGGLSQDELAARIGKDQRAVSEYELGKRRVSALDLPAIARELGVTVAYFYESAHTDDLDSVLLTEFHRLPNASAKQAAIGIVRAFSDSLAQQIEASSDTS